eukprot:766328-Hanusia_phi.AAC.3
MNKAAAPLAFLSSSMFSSDKVFLLLTRAFFSSTCLQYWSSEMRKGASRGGEKGREGRGVGREGKGGEQRGREGKGGEGSGDGRRGDETSGEVESRPGDFFS